MKDNKSPKTRCGRIDACMRKLKRIKADIPNRCEGGPLLRNVIESLKTDNIPMALDELNIIISQPGLLPENAFRQLNPIQTELHSIPKPLPFKKWLRILAVKVAIWIAWLFLKTSLDQWLPMNCTHLLKSNYLHESMLQYSHP